MLTDHAKTQLTGQLADMMKRQAERMQKLSLKQLFQQEPDRLDYLSFESNRLLFDFSKHRLDHESFASLMKFASERDLKNAPKKLLQAEIVNVSEHRPALHLLSRRLFSQASAHPLREDCERMLQLAEMIRQGAYTGANGQSIRQIILLGIGGSYWGPKLLIDALSPLCSSELKCFYVSTLDPSAIESVLKKIDPYQCLFIVASKSFSTIETLTNFRRAKAWWLEKTGSHPKFNQHFLAITHAIDKAKRQGFAEKQILSLNQAIGGRYSIWSSMALPAAIMLGRSVFERFLKAAVSYDDVCLTMEIERNPAMLHALLTSWYINYWKAKSFAIIPYDYLLRSLPSYLQQLIMESNGKACDQQGNPIDYETAAVIWGSHGLDAQHSYFQHLQQSQQLIPIDFIVSAKSSAKDQQAHELCLKSCLAQSRALMLGLTKQEATQLVDAADPKEQQRQAKYRVLPGNKPSTTIMLERLDPETLGTLLSHYEHKTFYESLIWDINCFDQPSVEYGKKLLQQLVSNEYHDDNLDPSTLLLMKNYQKYLNKE